MMDKGSSPEVEEYLSLNETDIAVIGMACRFPGAENYEEFWENLKQGRSDISEIPRERWDWKAYWGDPLTERNKSNSKWGGFIRDADAFDPGFFGLSAREVEATDPQQRIMLELAWACFEDAGILPSGVSGKKVGVYIGVFNFDYKELQEKKSRTIETYHSIGTASAVITNRISHYFNLKGPSFPIDTACSSSLNAIHSAVQSLYTGECSMALAGGISLLLTPTRHISFSKTGMLSPTGSCKTFDESADGYVRSEGAGLILLKPLRKAVEEGDTIYGILKGSAVNHNGKTHTLTYPNPQAQAEVISEAYRRAGITPESVSYIEAHGTGTPKGDPMEFQGLLTAFEAFNGEGSESAIKNYCGLGSVKTNIGHLESAAGIAGIIKVLLSMKHKQLPGLYSFKKLNHRIQLDSSPFYIVERLQEWKPLKGKDGQTISRRAGVSSFGFGGTNAHVVLEEAPVITKNSQSKLPFYLICLSAKTEEALLQKERQLADWLERGGKENNLADISATLLWGREHFSMRAAYVASDIEELRNKLKEALEKGYADGYFRETDAEKAKQTQPLYEELSRMLVKELHPENKQEYGNKLMALAELFVKGYEVDWNKVLPIIGTTRVNLPTYPFARERYWIPDDDAADEGWISKRGASGFLHPLLHKNTSDFLEQRFSSTFTGNEFFLADHVVKGQRILPGAAYLEMAFSAVNFASESFKEGQTRIKIKNVVWPQPVVVREQPVQVHIGLFPEENGEVDFEVYSCPDDVQPLVHSQGSVVKQKVAEIPVLDYKALQEQCIKGSLSSQQCYKAFQSIGLDYGPGHRGIESVYIGQRQVLAKLSLPPSVKSTENLFTLHPSIVDSAVQTAVALFMESKGLLSPNRNVTSKLFLPFALEELEVFQGCTSSMWSLVRYSGSGKSGDEGDVHEGAEKFDIDLCDEHGTVCVRMKGFSWRISEGTPGSLTSGTVFGNLLYPHWKEKNIVHEPEKPLYDQHLVILCEPDAFYKESREAASGKIRCVTLQSSGQKSIEERFRTYTAQVFKEIQSIMKDKSKSKVLVQIATSVQEENMLFAGLSGLLKTARLENPKITGQLIEFGSGKDAEGIMEKLREDSLSPQDSRIRYCDGKRMVMDWSEAEVNPEGVSVPWKDGGIYLVTGGAGGLGIIFAREIAQQARDAVIVLTGRSSLSEDKQAQLKELLSLGARVEYRQTDVRDRKAVADLVQGISKKFGGLNGIIHSAGVIRDSFILKKSREEVQEVLAPKVSGVVNLDEESSELDLDFFILFSSIVSASGNPGQADYAAANAFMDAYAEYRNMLTASKQRRGRTLSINWPLWKEGGMGNDGETAKLMLQNTGASVMETSAGISALYHALVSGRNQALAFEGDFKRFGKLLKGNQTGTEGPNTVQVRTKSEAVPVMEQNMLSEKAVNYFKKLISSVLKLPVQKIDAKARMENYGIDSIMVMQLTNKLEEVFGSLSKTLFFEYRNIQELTGYFLEHYREQLVSLIGMEERTETPAVHREKTENITVKEKPVYEGRRRLRFAASAIRPPQEKADNTLDIAIIGVSGRYPGAGSIHEFWENLRDGRDCITEIPKERWDHSLYFDQDRNKPGKTYSKWGGFLEGVDKFDPLFFNISPREAEIMDPQERLFLECVYETLEDAGYTREGLGMCRGNGLEGNVGVYVGVMYEEYPLYAAQEQVMGRPAAVFGIPASIANRVSYFCNFHGPSMTVDTMCSSSLTAIHLACQSLLRGECEVSIAGGVNISIHPHKYLMLAQGKFVSSKGWCESFGMGGDGYVPGEGVGAVLLKPLSKAVADRDHIYGVIKGTSINHGGKNNGYTVPNPNSQADVIGRAFKEAGIDPRTVSYIEAHGTGTSLGDPIEIAGLSKVFREYTKDTQFCAIGSAKSNIGHCESAAGIAGVTKVLMQLKYRQLAPSLHSGTLNPNIDFSSTPFVVQQELAEWKRPLVSINGETREYPRIAGISSFGAGGSNAHVVIEEYILSDREMPKTGVNTYEPAIIVLSAKNEDRLKEKVRRLLDSIEDQRFSDNSLVDIAYTLQIGREAMEERLGIIVGSIKELKEKLEYFLKSQDNIESLYRGQIKHNKEMLAVFDSDEDMEKTMDAWVNKRKYSKLLELWVKGLDFDWSRLYGDAMPCRISLPVYPFSRERYWIPVVNNVQTPGISDAVSAPVAVLHPLVHQNTSDLSEQRYTSIFTGHEFFLADHIVKNRRVLPAAALLEMARAAAEQAAGAVKQEAAGLQLKNVVWARQIDVDDKPVRVHIALFPEEGGGVGYEVYGGFEGDNGESVIHSQGSAVLNMPLEVPSIDIEAIKDQCKQGMFESSQCYEDFSTAGLEYGPGHRCIEEVHLGAGHVLAKLSLPLAVSDTLDRFVLHPGLVDSALQASLVLLKATGGDALFGSASSMNLMLPFAVEKVEIFNRCTSEMWAYIGYSGDISGSRVKRLDMDLCDRQGKVCLRMKGLSLRIVEERAEQQVSYADNGILSFEPCWNEQAVVDAPALSYEHRVVVLCEIEGNSEYMPAGLEGVRCLSLQEAPEMGIGERFESYAVSVFEEIQNILRNKPQGNVLIQVVVNTQEESLLLSGLSGLLKTARLENSKLIGQLIETEPEMDTGRIIEILKEDSLSPMDICIRYKDGRRYVGGWKELESAGRKNVIQWKDEGVYLITGGAGGLGLIFAREIASKAKDAVVILTGRSMPDESKRAQFEELQANGIRAIYRQADVTRKDEVAGLIESILNEFGKLHGIIHSAGSIRDSFIIKKTRQEFLEVLSPKARGLVNLDEASKGVQLDFFILFSSITGGLGNSGQADYAAANAFMDKYAVYRNTLVDSNKRCGQTISVNWPLWEEGGMHTDEETVKLMRKNMGITPLQTSNGIYALYQALASGKGQVMIMEGDTVRIKQKLLTAQAPVITHTKACSATPSDTAGMALKVQAALIQEVSAILKVKTEDIDTNSELNDYGFDSVTFTAFANQLNDRYKLELTPTVFFEYPTIGSLAKHLVKEYPGVFSAKPVSQINCGIDVRHVEDKSEKMFPARKVHTRFARDRVLPVSGQTGSPLEPIAIIGISGVFPGAGDIDELWENLLNGRGCITEIPKTRWSWEEYYGDPVREANKTNIKWGGFIDGVDKFDPVFFGVSPREAAFMDPQQRLMMTHIWKAIEDAGYSAQSLSGSKTAIFMGTGNSGYSELLSRANVTIEGYSSTGMVPSVGPNRMSYFLNIHGPSEPVETACSSSLVAIHRAVCAIREGTCDMAAAGGVNTILTPDLHISFNKAGMLCEDGRCKTFSDKANGYVRGEGAGVVLLKKLKDAERDGDHIYGVILSTAENHGGRANSLTAPNPKAQAELLVSAYQRAGIHPGTVSYIEAHGTGTELGDPIEINGLKTAFKELYRTTGDSEAKENHCGLGSIKTNIGHLELAAGIAGVIKVLLQMKHKTLVKSLYCDTVNPYIQLQDSPFYIARKTKEWESLKDEQGRDIPRRAGVSSFGFGGVNAHVVMEEYVPKVKDGSKLHVSVQGAAIIVLSAKNEERLKERAAQLLCAINDGKIKEDCLTDMAYTLQIGRDAMEERLAMLVESLEDLAEKLKSFVDGREGIPGLYRGQMKHNKNTISVFEADEEMQEAVEKWIKRGKFDKLMDLWVRGLNFDWNKLYGNAKPSRISLPTYPFARERYWVPEDRIKKTGKPDNNAAGERLDSFGVSIDRKSGILGYSETSGKPEGISLQLLSDYEAIPAEPPEPIQEPSALTPSRNTASLQKNSTIPELDVHIRANTINKLAEVEFKEAVHVRPEVHEKAKASGNTQLLQALRDELTESLAKALYMDSSQVDKDKKFVEMGLDSIVGVEWIRDINKKYGTSIAATKVYDYPTIREFAEFLQRELDGQERGPVKVSAKPAGPLSVDELLRQVQQGALDVGNASQLLSKLNV